MNLTQFNRVLLQTLLVPVLALAAVAAILALQLNGAHRTVNAIQQTDDIIAAATRSEKLIVDQEAGLRGYQITGDAAFLQPYNEAATPLARTFDALRHDFAQQFRDPAPINAIEDAYSTWEITFARPLLASLTTGEPTRDVTLNLRGKKQMDALRAAIDRFIATEKVRSDDEELRWNSQFHRTLVIGILLVLAAGILISVFTVSRMHRVMDAYQGTLDGLSRHARATFQSEERLRTILTSIGDGVIVTDSAGCVELLNTVAEQLIGCSHSDAHDRPIQDVFQLVHEGTRDAVESPVTTVLQRKGVASSAQSLLLRPDGAEIAIDVSGAPIYDRSGNLTGVVMVFRDITIERRTQTALIASEKLATAGRLAATIAHEIHNPLDSVVNLLYLLRDETDPSVSGNYLDLAQAELTRMGQVSRALLGLYRESNAPISVNVRETIEGVLTLLERPIKLAQIQVQADVPGDLAIAGYPAELRQVLTNLVVNALDASAPGAEIRIAAAPSLAARGSILVEVSDNGTGIAADALQHVFEPFFTTKGEKGTGLGLWVSRSIIEKHNGKVDIRSSTAPEDHGTFVTLTLPRAAS